MTHLYKYFLLFLFFKCFGISSAQDTLKNNYYLTIGADIVGPIEMAINPNRKMAEMSVTIGSHKNFYGSLEGGYLKFDEKNEKYDYKSNGEFLRIGFD